MLRLLLTLVLLGLLVYSAIDCAQSPAREVRGLSKFGWLLAIVAVPVLGPLAWFAAGRPQQGRHVRVARYREVDPAPVQEAPLPGIRRVIGPDDDPEFLAELGRRQEELRRRPGEAE